MNAPVLSNREFVVSLYTTPRDIVIIFWALAREIGHALATGIWLGPYRGPEHEDYD
jgi:hypothetical protein